MAKSETTRYPLLRFLIRSLAEGVAVGWSLLLVLLWADINGFGTLVRSSPSKEIATLMLAVMFAITFGSAAMGIAVFWKREGDPDET